MFTIKILLNLKKDAWNWWHACNTISHGVDWKKKIDPKIANYLSNNNLDDSYKYLLPILKKYYYEKNNLQKYTTDLQRGFDIKKIELFKTMSKITSYPIYRKKFTCFITSFPRFPYNYEKGQIWISDKKNIDYQLSIFIHELLHFQFFKYYGEEVWSQLGKDKYSRLKEAMTIIINDEFSDITTTIDTGYEIDKMLRKELLDIWRQEKSMPAFIKKSIIHLKN